MGSGYEPAGECIWEYDILGLVSIGILNVMNALIIL